MQRLAGTKLGKLKKSLLLHRLAKSHKNSCGYILKTPGSYECSPFNTQLDQIRL